MKVMSLLSIMVFIHIDNNYLSLNYNLNKVDNNILLLIHVADPLLCFIGLFTSYIIQKFIICLLIDTMINSSYYEDLYSLKVNYFLIQPVVLFYDLANVRNFVYSQIFLFVI